MLKYFVLSVLALLIYACAQDPGKEQVAIEEVNLDGENVEASDIEAKKLSELGFFKSPMNKLEPAEGVVPYDLATPLFSDYAFKARFVKLPEGKMAKYHPTETMDFPEGTILIKNFYYPADFRKPEGERRILETRLLINEGEEWKAEAYVWNEEQTEAYLEIAGERINISWVHYNGVEKQLNYSVPTQNQCKGCHSKSNKMMPIGPTSRQLNKQFDYADVSANQLKYWSENGLLAGLHQNISELDAVPLWDDPESGNLEQRARAYLDINCAHCHRAEGPANTSGFFLDYYQKRKTALGIYKSPIAAGRGSGGLKYDIHPGKPDSSILYFRMISEDPGIMMPELGKKMVHTEGVELIRKWIAQMN
ncbi:MAG: SO2930 family diheme c-type cytochrome [Chitinophagales bacterium]